ncbi:hypothetical protein ENSA5_43630 [Enhygromyxa salina]|uniref:Uncharacterized protein n=1 Tax=Enhygromyxa salina TaxID=215803 RepID=A0A2S9XK60_9BACT|nr:hypothetical protein [Enhygromyxa salina]PRP93268.1 hypothetical protein ENSA5_43630 [Enhygromyxa salina]
MTWVYLVLAAIAALGLLQTMRGEIRSRRYLASSPEESPLQLSHLSTRLQALARDTRALRLSLEGPLRDGRHLDASVSIRDFDETQQILSDAAREIGDWIHELERLGPNDRAYLHDVGAQSEAIRALFEAEGWSLERKRKPGQPPLHKQLERLVRELTLFEERLQTPPSPYR